MRLPRRRRRSRRSKRSRRHWRCRRRPRLLLHRRRRCPRRPEPRRAPPSPARAAASTFDAPSAGRCDGCCCCCGGGVEAGGGGAVGIAQVIVSTIGRRGPRQHSVGASLASAAFSRRGLLHEQPVEVHLSAREKKETRKRERGNKRTRAKNFFFNAKCRKAAGKKNLELRPGRPLFPPSVAPLEFRLGPHSLALRIGSLSLPPK